MVKSVLVIFSQGAVAGQTVLEALSATMVLATFGLNIKVCLINEAVSLLHAPTYSNVPPHSQAFKSAHAMVESFEFYDLLPIWVCPNPHIQFPELSSPIEHEFVELNPTLLAQFDQVLYW